MAKPRSFRGLTEIHGLSDKQVRELVLGNWHKLNTVLLTKPAIEDIKRLFCIEFRREPRPRVNFMNRLRSALSSAQSREARDALNEVMRDIFSGENPRADALRALGLENCK